MTNTTRRLVVAAMVAGTMAAARPVVAGTDEGSDIARVRSSNPAIAALIQQAAERSDTFRRLVAQINASDGIVYVEQGTCGHGVRACFTNVTGAGANRLLRVKVDTRKADWDLMGSIGHELRHTLEVLSHTDVRTDAGRVTLYMRIGTKGTAGSVETQVAVDAGNAVRSEVRKALRHAAAN